MAKVIMEAKGIYGSLLLTNDRVIIRRPGIINFIRYGKLARREIPLSQISEVIHTPPTWLTVGDIEFVRAGSSRDDHREKYNANSLKFSRRKAKDFETIKEKIFELIGQK